MKKNTVIVGLLAGLHTTPASASVYPLDNPAPAPSQLPAPEPAPPSISPGLFTSLERMARLVDVSYCVGTTGISKPFQCASRCREFPSLKLVKTWNTGIMMSDSCGYIAVNAGEEKEIVVAFRGTYSVTNTVVDLTTVPQEYKPYPVPDEGDDEKFRCDNCTVHSGFYQSWQEAKEIVLPILHDLRDKYPDYPIHLVGHSLGGAVATLASLELRLGLDWKDTVTTTFGEPRVGNQGVADLIDRVFSLDNINPETGAALRRVTHADDPVPLLPPTEWGYSPHGGEIFISKAELYPDLQDVQICAGQRDRSCITGDEEAKSILFTLSKLERTGTGPFGIFRDAEGWVKKNRDKLRAIGVGIPRLWELFFAHRDYFWRLGLCVPGGDPRNWKMGTVGYDFEKDEMTEL